MASFQRTFTSLVLRVTILFQKAYLCSEHSFADDVVCDYKNVNYMEL